MEKQDKKLKIAVISFDWRNIFENNFDELIQKLKRDRLNPDFNEFFFISWSVKKYHKKIKNIETVHFKAFFGWRIFCDLMSDFLVPIILGRHNFKPDIVLVYDFPLIYSGIFAKIFWGSKIVLFLGNMPSGLVRTRKFPGWRYYYQKSAEFAGKYFVDQFFVISESTKKYVVDLEINAEKIKIITPDILERDKEFILVSQKGTIRKKYNIADDKKILLSVGRLEPEKGFNDLLAVFNSLKQNDLILIVVGEGSQKDKLIRQAKDLNMENRIVFAGYQSRENIWNYYQDADIFILLSRSEGLGLVFWEAMFMGVPVIGTLAGGIKETIGHDGERGFYWKNDPEDLKNKIDFCLDKGNNERRFMVERAQEYIRQKLESKTVINDLLS